jgi:large subunit ribosomal protein L25
MEQKLKVEKRTIRGTKACRALRETGKLPAVVYGEGKEAETISLDAKDFEKMWKNVGESTVISLEGLGENKSVLIQDVVFDPLYSTPTHVDFYTVRTDKVVEVEVPLVFEGVAPAVKELGGNLVKVMHTISIESLPKDLPQEIIVDITSLKTFEDQIKINDIVLPTGVKATSDGDEVIALVQPAREEEEQTSVADVTSVAVEKKGKEEISE